MSIRATAWKNIFSQMLWLDAYKIQTFFIEILRLFPFYIFSISGPNKTKTKHLNLMYKIIRLFIFLLISSFFLYAFLIFLSYRWIRK